jgi:hypothetical protein
MRKLTLSPHNTGRGGKTVQTYTVVKADRSEVVVQAESVADAEAMHPGCIEALLNTVWGG